MTAYLQQMYRTVIEHEFLLEGARDDVEVQYALSRAREEYGYAKEHAIDTAADQEGLTAEEIAAALREASGEVAAVEEVAVDANTEAELRAEIEKQRAEEQRIKLELVAKAEEESKAAKEEADRLAAE